MSTTPLITADQFEQMQFADIEDYELVEGELVPWSSGSLIHAEIRDLLGDLLSGGRRMARSMRT